MSSSPSISPPISPKTMPASLSKTNPKSTVPIDHPLRIKLVAWAGLVSVQLFSSIVLKVAHVSNGNAYAFHPQSSLVLSELIKVILSFSYLLHGSKTVAAARHKFKEETCVGLVLHMFGLASIYCLNNGLMFWLFARADPGSISLMKSAGTVVSAGMMYLVRGFTLSGVRWGVLVSQMFGLVGAQWDACKEGGGLFLPMSVYVVLVMSLVNSCVANVWNEWVVKKFDGAGLATKNVWLYIFGCVLNLGVFYSGIGKDGGNKGFWEGYFGWGAVVVISNAFMGIAMNAVYKYADAVVKNVATTTTTVVLLAVSAVMFNGRRDLMVFVGGGVVVVATFLYFKIGGLEERMEQLVADLLRQKGGQGSKEIKVRGMRGASAGLRTFVT